MGPLMIEITDRHELVMHTRDLWSRLTAEERQEVITGGPVAPRVIKAEWREMLPEELPAQVTPPQEFPKVPNIPGTVSFYEAVTGQKPPPQAVHKVLGDPRIGVGFTGDVCDSCGSAQMVRTGTCLTCQSCGTPSGGCS